MDKNKVIVLILSYNGKHLLDDSISSYLENNYHNFKVIVIDNGSTDGTEEYVNTKWKDIKVLRTEKNLGYSGGFNFGLDYAFNRENSEYVLITNNDVKADSKVISELVKVAKTDQNIGFVTGKVYYFDNPNIFQTVGFSEDKIKWVGGHIGINQEDKGQYDQIEERFFSDDIFILVSKKLYNEVGGYDTEFQFQAEQFDWQIRAKKIGFKIFFAPHAKIWHKDSMTIGKNSPFKTFYNVRNPLVVRLKHRDRNYLKIFFPWYLKNVVFIPLVKYSLKLQFDQSISIIKGFFSALYWWIKNRKGIADEEKI